VGELEPIVSLEVEMPAPITIRYDLDSGTLVQRGSQSPGASGAAEQDNFLGSLIALSGATFAPGDTQLTVRVEFVDRESGVKQSLRLKDLGVGSPYNPSSFVGATLGDPPPAVFPNNHKFAPGLSFGGPNLPAGAQLTVDITLIGVLGAALPPPSMTANPVTDFASPNIVSSDPNAFEYVMLPDLLDGNQEATFSGFTLNLTAALPAGVSSFSLDQMQFNLGSAQVDLLRDALPLHDVRFGTDARNNFTAMDAPAIFFGEGGNDSLTGGGFADILFGQEGHDRLSGGFANDRLFGGDGNDRINGGGDDDEIRCGAGNDRANGGAGDDRVFGGSGHDRLNGGEGDDQLRGESGDDRLDGGLGADLLRGGSGFDRFTFSTSLGPENIDTINDFRGSDTIVLDNDVFTGLTAGVLRGSAFRIGTTAVDGSDRIIYDTVSGALYFDPDGVGGADQIQFATIAGSPNNVTARDFLVIL
jgi:serralysin